MNREKYTFPQMSLSYRLMPYYFIFLIIGVVIFVQNIEIRKSIELAGEIKNYTPIETVNAKYTGLIKNIFIEEDKKIKKGDKLFSIKIKDNEKISRENKITYYEEKLKQNQKVNNELEIKKIKEELQALKAIKTERIQYSDIDGLVYYKKIKKNEKIEENEEVMQIKTVNANNIYFVETYVNLENFLKIKENDLVLIKFPFNQTNLYTSYVHKKYENMDSKKTKKFKITILLNYYPPEIREGVNVKLKIVKEKISVYNWIKSKLNGNI